MPTIPFTPNRQPSAPPPDPDDSDFAALKAADNQDSDWYRGQQTDPQGFFALTGQDAWAGLADFRRQTMDRIDQAAQTLTNRIAQDTYRAIAAKRAEPVLAQAQAHAETQRDQAWDEISQTRQANAIADGAANWQDQRLYTRHFGAGAAEVEDQARRQGWDQARTQQAKQDYARDFTKAMVEQAATTDPQAARALLDRYRIDLAGDRDQLITQIDRHALFADARKTADAVLAQAGDHPLDTLLAQATTPDNSALQAETERMIKAGFRTREQARKQADEETLKQAWAGVKSGQTPDQLPTALRDHPAVIGQWDALWAHALGEEGGGDPEHQLVSGSVATQPLPSRSSISSRVAKPELTANETEAGGSGASRDGNGRNTVDSKPASVVSPSGAAAPQNPPTNQGTGNATAGGVSDAFLDAIYNAEQGGKVGGNRNPAEQGPGTTKGKYQITDETLRSIGWKDATGKWTRKAEKHGIKNDQDFLKSDSAQNAAGKQVFDEKRKTLEQYKAFDKSGQRIKGLKADFSITDNGLLAAAHRDGEQVVLDYLKHQKKNGWKSNFDNLDPKMRKWDIKDASGKVTRTAEDRFRAIETRIRTFENVK